MTDRNLEIETSSTPEDVATLYTWANLHGAKYRDFSASRQELRAQSRHRLLEEQDAVAAEAIRQTAVAQQREMGAAAPEMGRVAAPPIWASQADADSHWAGTQSQRVGANTNVPASPTLAPSISYLEMGLPEPIKATVGAVSHSYPPQHIAQQNFAQQNFAPPFAAPQYQAQPQQQYVPQNFGNPAGSIPHMPQQYLPQSFSIPAAPVAPAQSQPERAMKHYQQADHGRQLSQQPEPTQPMQKMSAPEAGLRLPSATNFKTEPTPDQHAPQVAPRRGWFQQETDSAVTPERVAVSDTLQQSSERVASRWFALKGVFDQNQEHETQVERRKEVRIPTLAIFSLAGGVGKTSMVATLGRALSAHGERLLLADTTTYGLLPFYFGAREVRPGIVRSFSGGNTAEPISVVSLDTEQRPTDAPDSDRVLEEIKRDARGTNRVILDMATASGSLTRRVLSMMPTVLVPVVPDMNSVVSLSVVDSFFRKHEDATGRPLRAFYVLNQFDPSIPLHLDVREVLRQQLGDQLLPFVLRHSPAISEALAEGMTVIDYAPTSPIAEDYMHLADWIRSISATTSAGARGVRWSER